MKHASEQGRSQEMQHRQAISFLMKLISDRVTCLFQQRADLPLTAAQSRVLMYLEACGGGPMSQRELEQYLNVSHTTAKGLLQRMEEKGFVRTAFDSADGRVKNAYLTDKARRCRDELSCHINALTEMMMTGLSHEEELQLFELLRRVYRNIR